MVNVDKHTIHASHAYQVGGCKLERKFDAQEVQRSNFAQLGSEILCMDHPKHSLFGRLDF